MDSAVKASSTEKLLELIRGSGNTGAGGKSPAPQPVVPKKKPFSGFSLSLGKAKASGSKGPRLGVEVNGERIRMVRLTGAPGKGGSLEFKTVDIPPQGPEAPELSLVLRLALKDFLGKDDAEVWAMVPAESADLRFIQVPKAGKKQLSNAVYWTARKEAAFDENEVVFDYELQGEIMEKGAPKFSVLAYTVKREEFEKLRNLFLQAGYPLAGVTTPSVAMRNLLRGGWLEEASQTQACLHLGQEFSRVEIFGGGNLQFVRVVKGGLASLAQSLTEASQEYVPPAPAKPAAPAAPEESAQRAAPTGLESMLVSETPAFSGGLGVEIEAMDAGLAQQVEKPRGLEPGEALRLLEDFALDPEALPEDHPGRRFPHQAVIAMLEPAWERLLRQVQMTFSHHAVTLGNEQVSHLIVSGPLGTDAGLLTFLSERLGLPCRPLDPLAPENLGRLGLKGPMLALEERLPYVMAAGLTGSARGECNLLFTYRQKEEEDRADTLNKVVVLCWLGLAVVAAGVYGWQMVQAHLKEQVLAGQDAILAQFTPQVDMPLLLNTASKVRSTVENLRRFGQRTLAVAVLRDVTELTPENVRLFEIVLDLGAPEEQPLGPSGADPKAQAGSGGAAPRPQGLKPREGLDSLTLEGFVKGDSTILESLLSAYLVRLRTSPLLGEPSVSKRSLEMTAQGEEVLRFTLTCQVRR